MEQRRDKRSRTAPEIRLAIQQSGASVATLAAHYGVDPKTVRRWRERASVNDHKTGPKNPRSTVLSLTAEAAAIAVRWLTQLPLDDCYHSLRSFLPGLTRASLHRCFRRHAVSRLPSVHGAPARSNGEFDLHMLQFAEGTHVHCLFIAVERASKYIFAELYPTTGRVAIVEFLQALSQSAPVRVRTVFTERQGSLASLKSEVARGCAAVDTAHRRVEASWAPEQKARVDRILVEAVRNRGVEYTTEQLRSRLSQCTHHYNSTCRFKALGGLTPQVYLARAATIRGFRRETNHGRSSNSVAVDAGHALTNRVRDPEGTRAAILQAARELLARVGPQGMSLSEVARIAGVDRGTAYQHFKSRKRARCEDRRIKRHTASPSNLRGKQAPGQRNGSRPEYPHSQRAARELCHGKSRDVPSLAPPVSLLTKSRD